MKKLKKCNRCGQPAKLVQIPGNGGRYCQKCANVLSDRLDHFANAEMYGDEAADMMEATGLEFGNK